MQLCGAKVPVGLLLRRADWDVAIGSSALLALAFVLRATKFGDPFLHVDDEFYRFVGQQMLHGALPYVDIWDRKPLGLFLIYAAFATISSSSLVYQVAATFSAAATATVVMFITRKWSSLSGGVLAGAFYLTLLGPLEGHGGQAPVFYNLLVALAVAALLQSEFESRRLILLSMALLGLALTIKQTVLFEAAGLGLYTLARLRGQARVVPIALAMIALGVLPTALIYGVYALGGHFAEIWHATVTSNFAKSPAPVDAVGARLVWLGLILVPAFGLASLGLVLGKGPRGFLLVWLGAAICGFAAVPNAYIHYALPLALPLSAAAAGILERRLIGPGLFVLAVTYSFIFYNPARSFGMSRPAAEAVAAYVRSLPGNDMLILEGPVGLYGLTDRQYLSPLVFPNHLNHLIEKDVSHLSTASEIRRILASHPSVVIATTRLRNNPINQDSWDHVARYTKNCPSRRFRIYEMGRAITIEVWNCAEQLVPRPRSSQENVWGGTDASQAR